MSDTVMGSDIRAKSEQCTSQLEQLSRLVDDTLGSELVGMAGDIDTNDPRVDSAAVSDSLDKLSALIVEFGESLTDSVNDVDVSMSKVL